MGCVYTNAFNCCMEYTCDCFCNKLIQEVRFWNGSSSVADYRGLNFLKRHFVLTDTGGVIIKPSRKGITKMRRKLRTFKRWLVEGKIAIEDIRTSYISWKGHIKHCNAYRTVLSMDALFGKLFPEAAEFG